MLKKYFRHFSFFYNYLSYRIFVSMILNVSVGLLDGFGIVMFLPFLQMVDGKSQVTSDDLGNLGVVVKSIEKMGLRLDLIIVLLSMLLFFSLKGVARFIESLYRNNVQFYFVRNLRVEGVNLLRGYSYSSFVNSDSGRIQNTLSGEINRVSAASNSYFMTLQCTVMALVYGVLAFLANAQFAIMVVVGGFLSNLVFKIINRRTISISKEITVEGHDYQGLLIQEVSFFKYLKATGLIEKFSNKIEDIVVRIESNGRKIGVYGSILYASREPIIIAVAISVIFIQTYIMGQNLGLIILSLLFFYRALTYVMSLQTFYNNFLANSGSLENMRLFLDELKLHQDQILGKQSHFFKNEIKFCDVSFSYGNKLIVSNIDLVIKKNESIALVGESGSGKTTLVNLISGLITTDSGELVVDGIPLKNLDIKNFQSRIGYITQDPVIFSDSIYNNVTFWAEKNESNLNRFWDALKRAHINDFIQNLPDKEDSLLGNNGVLVSGGQKQRISIARELYKDIDILIMDEATSALDSESEKNIQENIESLKGKITLIIVAHRLATIRNVDRVVLLSKGKIEGVDAFKNLVQASDKFRRMVELQTF